MRKGALPIIAQILAAWPRLIPPSKTLTVEAAASGKLPFGLGGQALARPLGISQRVLVADLDHGMVVSSLEVAAGAFWMLPAHANYQTPPFARVGLGGVERFFRGLEHQRKGPEFGRCLPEADPRQAGWETQFGKHCENRRLLGLVAQQLHARVNKLLGIWRALHHRHITGRLDEGSKLGVGDLGLVHPEAVNVNLVDRPGVIEILATHPEDAAGDPDHTVRFRSWRTALVNPHCPEVV